jgi:hypothetical protein
MAGSLTPADLAVFEQADTALHEAWRKLDTALDLCLDRQDAEGPSGPWRTRARELRTRMVRLKELRRDVAALTE